MKIGIGNKVKLLCTPLLRLRPATHLVQHNDSLFISSSYVEYFSLLSVQDGKLQLCIFSQIRISGSETAHLHTWSRQL